MVSSVNIVFAPQIFLSITLWGLALGKMLKSFGNVITLLFFGWCILSFELIWDRVVLLLLCGVVIEAQNYRYEIR